MSVSSRSSKGSKVSFKLIDSQIKDSTEPLELLILHVGWSKPSQATNAFEALGLNFHLNYKPTGQIWSTFANLKSFSQFFNSSFQSFEKNLDPPSIPFFEQSRAEEILAYFKASPLKFNYEITVFLEHFVRSVEMWGQYIIDHLICLNQYQKTVARRLFFSTVQDKFQDFISRQELIKSQFPQYFDDLYNNSDYTRPSVRMSEAHRSLSKHNLDKLQEQLSTNGTYAPSKSKNSTSNSVFGVFKKNKAEKESPAQLSKQAKNVSSLPKVTDVANSLKVEVQRGSSSGSFISYDIVLKVTSRDLKHPKMHSCSQRYSHFKKLYQQLNDVNYKVTSSNSSYANFINLITVAFPSPPIKCFFGMTLNDSDLSLRTQGLDSWMRDVIKHYKDMPNEARQLIKEFLHLDMTNKKDIYIQDQMMWGFVEKVENSRNFLFLHKNIEDNLADKSNKNFHKSEEISSVLLATGVLDNTNTATNKANPNTKDIETNSVRSNNSDSGSLVWETASLGGSSKLQNNKPLIPRHSLFNNKEV